MYRRVARILNKTKFPHAQDEGRIFLRICGTNLPFCNGVRPQNTITWTMKPVTNFLHLHLPSVTRRLFCFSSAYPVPFETKFCGASLMANLHSLFSVQNAAHVGARCGCRSGRNVSHYTAPSRFSTNTPQSVILENPGATANEMKLWIFKLFHSLKFNNEQLLESWRTEFPFCERAKRRWRVWAGNGKQTLHILHLLRSLVVCRLKQVCRQNGVHVWGCVCSLVCVWGPVWPLECLKLIEQREKKEGHGREENLYFVLVLKNWRTFIQKTFSCVMGSIWCISLNWRNIRHWAVYIGRVYIYIYIYIYTYPALLWIK